MSAHSKLAPSSADRWLNCPASVSAIDALIESGQFKDSSGEPAKIGTVAHEVLERCLNEGCDAIEYFDQEITIEDGFTYKVDEEMVRGVQICLDLVDSIIEDNQDNEIKMYSELKLNSSLDNEAFGTSDVVMAMFDKHTMQVHTLVVIDLKYGVIEVSPDSSQLKIYGAMAAEFLTKEGFKVLNDTQVDLYISQPRGYSSGQYPNKKHTIQYDNLKSWYENRVIPAMKKTREKSENYNPGLWCEYCPFRSRCPKIAEGMRSVLYSVGKDFSELTDEEKTVIAIEGSKVADWLTKTKEKCRKQIMGGKPIKGCKMVVWRNANRTFKQTLTVDNEDGTTVNLNIIEEAEKTFGLNALSIKSIADIEKLDKDGSFLEKWVHIPETPLYALVSESHKKDAVDFSADSMFGEI